VDDTGLPEPQHEHVLRSSTIKEFRALTKTLTGDVNVDPAQFARNVGALVEDMWVSYQHKLIALTELGTQLQMTADTQAEAMRGHEKAVREVVRLQLLLTERDARIETFMNTQAAPILPAATIRRQETTDKGQQKVDGQNARMQTLMAQIMALSTKVIGLQSVGQTNTLSSTMPVLQSPFGPPRDRTIAERAKRMSTFTEFNGMPKVGETYCRWQKWLRDFESQTALLDTNKQAWLPLFVMYLKGNAKDAYLRMEPSQRARYEDVCAYMEGCFPPEHNMYTASEKFVTLEQAPQESVFQFYTRVCEMANIASGQFASDDASRETQIALQMRQGVRRELRQRVREAPFGMADKLLQELLRFLQSLEVAYKSMRAEANTKVGDHKPVNQFGSAPANYTKGRPPMQHTRTRGRQRLEHRAEAGDMPVTSDKVRRERPHTGHDDPVHRVRQRTQIFDVCVSRARHQAHDDYGHRYTHPHEVWQQRHTCRATVSGHIVSGRRLRPNWLIYRCRTRIRRLRERG
jgi:hypothetical protein